MPPDLTLHDRYQVVERLEAGPHRGALLCDDLRLKKQWVLYQIDAAAAPAQLQHPGLPVVVDQFTEGGATYLVTDYAAGHDLETRLKEGPLPEDQAREVVSGLEELLAFLHSQEPPVFTGGIKADRVILNGQGAFDSLVLDWQGRGSRAQDLDCFDRVKRRLLPQPKAPIPIIQRDIRTTPTSLPVALLLMAATLAFLIGLAGPATTPGPSEPTSQRSEQIRIRKLTEQGRYDQARQAVEALSRSQPLNPEAKILATNLEIRRGGGPRWSVPLLVSLSGPLADDLRMLNGVALAQRQLLDAGENVELVLYDDQSRVDKLVANAQAIVADKKYAATVGPWTSQQLMAVAPIYSGARRPVVAPGATDPRVLEAGPYVFSAAETQEPRAILQAGYLLDQGHQTAAVVFNADNISSRSSAGAFRKAFEDQGGRVPSEVSYQESQFDFGGVVKQLKEAGVDCVYLAEWRAEPQAQFANAWRAAEMKPAVALHGITSPTHLAQLAGDSCNGFILTSTLDPESTRAQAFRLAFLEMFPGLEPTEWDANIYDVLNVVVEGLRQGEDLEKYLRALGKGRPLYQGVTGELSLDMNPRTKRFKLVEFRDGRFWSLAR